jgi:ubiquinone/menaquinone biosynthesis C-methylase UbiE
MATDYNPIALKYKQAKGQPWREHIERYTLFQLLGALRGKTVLDLACGEGFYTRRLKQQGAARVLGIDLSERMISLAREQEAREPLGAEYLVQDARTLDLGERFDLAVAGYLLNYAATKEELLAMCLGITRHLKPGGRFVTVNNNPAQPVEYFPASWKYGFVKDAPEEIREGMPVTWTFFLDEGPFEITNYHLSLETHERAFREAGFSKVTWQQPRLSPEGAAAFGEAFWASFLEHPPVIFLECVT